MYRKRLRPLFIPQRRSNSSWPTADLPLGPFPRRRRPTLLAPKGPNVVMVVASHRFMLKLSRQNSMAVWVVFRG